MKRLGFYCGALMLVWSVIPQVVLAQQVMREASLMPYSQPGTEAELGVVIEMFLSLAADLADLAEHPDVFESWCAKYRIDPNWPSARQLGSISPRIGNEFMSRAHEAHQTASFTTADGLDPNDWKNEEIGRAFGEVYEELLLDGYDMKLKAFLAIIRADTVPTFTTYSDEPFTESKTRAAEALFWKGLEATSAHARALKAEGSIQ